MCPVSSTLLVGCPELLSVITEHSLCSNHYESLKIQNNDFINVVKVVDSHKESCSISYKFYKILTSDTCHSPRKLCLLPTTLLLGHLGNNIKHGLREGVP